MPEIARSSLPDGLTNAEATALLVQYGRNALPGEGRKKTLTLFMDMAREPMFLILASACILYFILGEWQEGVMMGAAICIVSAISLYQDRKSNAALEALKEYMAPKVVVRREAKNMEVATHEIVPGDIILLQEGDRIPADCTLISSNDLTVNESILTGESLPIEKSPTEKNAKLHQGTLVNSGTCYALVNSTGANTQLAKIGKSLSELESPQTPLQVQINKFVRLLALFGILGFLVVCVVNYLQTRQLAESLLRGLTIAMSAIPEEIPVAFTSFMALGAYYLARRGIITRNPMTIENLGRASVVCLDKTGTITQNKMEVSHLFDFATQSLIDLKAESELDVSATKVLTYARLASERDPFDAMEVAIIQSATLHHAGKADIPEMIYEYPLGGQPPMMTHVYAGTSGKIVASKGGLERILLVCRLDAADSTRILEWADSLANQGHRVLGVAAADFTGDDFPQNQDNYAWRFLGFISLYDPPKANVAAVLNELYQEGVGVNLVTGDFPQTAISIAKQVGFHNADSYLTGEQVIHGSPAALRKMIPRTTIFARMFPDAKLRLIKMLQSSGMIVAMTGDGVNDGPALKAADIGIAMGKRGTETARQASSLVITNDDLSSIPEAIRQGRKIYSNLKKATRYIVAIHIPIILVASVPLLLGWKFPNLFTPIHVIFLELIMGPTCSIFFEREPPEVDSTPQKGKLFTGADTFLSISTGLVITLSLLFLQELFSGQEYELPYVRAMVFITLITSNFFLTFVYRSTQVSILRTMRYRNDFAPLVIAFSAVFIIVIQLVPVVRDVFGLALLSIKHLAWCFALGFGSVMWIELFKVFSHRPDKNQRNIS